MSGSFQKLKDKLSPSAQRVQDVLRAKGYPLTVIEFTESTRTAQEAAARVGVEVGQIVKSLVFRAVHSGRPILVLTSGANRVNEQRLASYVGEPVERADAEFVRAVSGFAIGGVAPIGHPQPLETYLDQDLLRYEQIWAAAGTPNAMFALTPAQLQEMTGARVVNIQ